MRFVWSGISDSQERSHVLFECPALHSLRIKYIRPDFADKQVLINNPEDVAGSLLEIDHSEFY